jgi:uncharacterized protein YigE (DUF2233 family)
MLTLVLAKIKMACLFVIVMTIFPLPSHSVDSNKFTRDNNSYETFIVNPEKDDLRLFWKNQAGKCYKTIKALRNDLSTNGYDLIFATNSGIYMNLDNGNRPLGLHLEDGKTLVRLNTKTGYGNFYVKPNGVFCLSDNGAAIFQTNNWKIKGNMRFASQSGPLLVINGQLNPGFSKNSTSANIRSGVGVRKSGEVVFVISNQPVTFWEFAILLKEDLKCEDALYFDGAISEMYVRETGRTEVFMDFAGIWAVVKRAKK